MGRRSLVGRVQNYPDQIITYRPILKLADTAALKNSLQSLIWID